MRDKFSVDSEHVYYHHKDLVKLKGIRPGGFEVVYQKQHHAYVERGYLKDEQGIWWFRGSNTKPVLKFVSDDLTHFEIIDDEYSRDSGTVFFSDYTHIAIPGSDPETFQRLGKPAYFAKDRNQVYGFGYGYREGFMIFHDADPATFVNTGYNGFAADRDHLFRYSHVFQFHNGSKYIECLDPANAEKYTATPTETLRLNQAFLYRAYPDIQGWWHPDYDFALEPPTGDSEGYLTKNGTVYYLEDDSQHLPFSTPVLIRSANVETFAQLDRWHARDANAVYYRWSLIPGADRDSFEVIGNHLSRDQRQIFYKGRVVDGVDYASFAVVAERSDEFRAAAQDNNALYFEKTKRIGKFDGYADYLLPVANSDPASLEIINECWAKDRNNVYRYCGVWDRVDVETFEYLFTANTHDHWAKDINHLFNPNGMRIVKGIEGATFEMLNQFWGKDTQRVFSFVTEKVLPAIDAASFRVTDQQGGAEDDSKVYWIDQEAGYPVLKRKSKPNK